MVAWYTICTNTYIKAHNDHSRHVFPDQTKTFIDWFKTD